MKMRKEKASYYSTQLAGKQDSKKTWKIINSILPKQKLSKNTDVQTNVRLAATKLNTLILSNNSSKVV